MKASPEERRESMRALESLLAKSEKAAGKLPPAGWSGRMLAANVRALRLAGALMRGERAAAFTADDLAEALAAIDDMVARTARAQELPGLGASSRTLLKRRLAALRTAREMIEDKPSHLKEHHENPFEARV